MSKHSEHPSTTDQAGLSPARLGLVHLARRRLAMEDADYRALLDRVAGVRSSKELDNAGFTAVMAEFARLSFVSSRNAPEYGERVGMASAKQIGMIRSLWRRYANEPTQSEENLRRFIQKKFNVSHLRFLDESAAHKLIGALTGMVAWRKQHPRPSAKARAAAALQVATPDAQSKSDDPPF